MLISDGRVSFRKKNDSKISTMGKKFNVRLYFSFLCLEKKLKNFH